MAATSIEGLYRRYDAILRTLLLHAEPESVLEKMRENTRLFGLAVLDEAMASAPLGAAYVRDWKESRRTALRRRIEELESVR